MIKNRNTTFRARQEPQYSEQPSTPPSWCGLAHASEAS